MLTTAIEAHTDDPLTEFLRQFRSFLGRISKSNCHPLCDPSNGTFIALRAFIVLRLRPGARPLSTTFEALLLRVSKQGEEDGINREPDQVG